MSSTISKDLYRKIEQFGEGSFGAVWKGINTQDATPVAIKAIDLERTEDSIELIQKEFEFLSRCECKNITRYHGSVVHGPELWIVMEFMHGGAVNELIKMHKLSENMIAYVLHETLKGLEYLHAINIIHRDIKGANILLSASGEVKLADFGVSGELEEQKKRTTIVGTPFWMAPEVIRGERGYDASADIWSLGITAIELATGQPPRKQKNIKRVLLDIVREPPPELPDRFSKHFRDFVATCLKKEPTERPTAKELLKHKFFSKITKKTRKHLRHVVHDHIVDRENKPDSKRLSTLDEIDLPDITIESGGGGGDSGGWTFDLTIRQTPSSGSSSNAVAAANDTVETLGDSQQDAADVSDEMSGLSREEREAALIRAHKKAQRAYEGEEEEEEEDAEQEDFGTVRYDSGSYDEWETDSEESWESSSDDDNREEFMAMAALDKERKQAAEEATMQLLRQSDATYNQDDSEEEEEEDSEDSDEGMDEFTGTIRKIRGDGHSTVGSGWGSSNTTGTASGSGGSGHYPSLPSFGVLGPRDTIRSNNSYRSSDGGGAESPPPPPPDSEDEGSSSLRGMDTMRTASSLEYDEVPPPPRMPLHGYGESDDDLGGTMRTTVSAISSSSEGRGGSGSGSGEPEDDEYPPLPALPDEEVGLFYGGDDDEEEEEEDEDDEDDEMLITSTMRTTDTQSSAEVILLRDAFVERKDSSESHSESDWIPDTPKEDAQRHAFQLDLDALALESGDEEEHEGATSDDNDRKNTARRFQEGTEDKTWHLEQVKEDDEESSPAVTYESASSDGSVVVRSDSSSEYETASDEEEEEEEEQEEDGAANEPPISVAPANKSPSPPPSSTPTPPEIHTPEMLAKEAEGGDEVGELPLGPQEEAGSVRNAADTSAEYKDMGNVQGTGSLRRKKGRHTRRNQSTMLFKYMNDIANASSEGNESDVPPPPPPPPPPEDEVTKHKTQREERKRSIQHMGVKVDTGEGARTTGDEPSVQVLHEKSSSSTSIEMVPTSSETPSSLLASDDADARSEVPMRSDSVSPNDSAGALTPRMFGASTEDRPLVLRESSNSSVDTTIIHGTPEPMRREGTLAYNPAHFATAPANSRPSRPMYDDDDFSDDDDDFAPPPPEEEEEEEPEESDHTAAAKGTHHVEALDDATAQMEVSTQLQMSLTGSDSVSGSPRMNPDFVEPIERKVPLSAPPVSHKGRRGGVQGASTPPPRQTKTERSSSMGVALVHRQGAARAHRRAYRSLEKGGVLHDDDVRTAEREAEVFNAQMYYKEGSPSGRRRRRESSGLRPARKSSPPSTTKAHTRRMSQPTPSPRTKEQMNGEEAWSRANNNDGVRMTETPPPLLHTRSANATASGGRGRASLPAMMQRGESLNSALAIPTSPRTGGGRKNTRQRRLSRSKMRAHTLSKMERVQAKRQGSSKEVNEVYNSVFGEQRKEYRTAEFTEYRRALAQMHSALRDMESVLPGSSLKLLNELADAANSNQMLRDVRSDVIAANMQALREETLTGNTVRVSSKSETVRQYLQYRWELKGRLFRQEEEEDAESSSTAAVVSSAEKE